uniref:Transposase n=1 Tax=uncultured bacterium 20 TaxID=1748270 RepID=A0A0U3JGL7_9BACT|nr:transposase [uncultured bacterium 20]
MIARPIRDYHSHIREFLTRVAEAKARQSRFVQRRSRLTGALFAQILIWTVFQTKARTLQAYLDTLRALAPEVALSPQGLDERFTPSAVAFVRSLFVEALASKASLGERTGSLLTSFPALYILDSTSVPLPETLAERFRGWGGSASKAGAKLFLVLNWLTGTITQLHVSDGRTPDQKMGQTFLGAARTGALWLFDLGFWSCGFLSEITRQGSAFLCRLQGKVTVREVVCGRDLPLNVDEWLHRAVGSKPVERRIVLGQGAQRVACRLIAFAVPEAVAAERRRKLRRKAQNQGRTSTQSTLFRQGYSLFVTTATKEQIPTKAVSELYRVRWQVELLFKLAKSDAGLTSFTSTKAERVLCEFYCVLIALLWVAQLRSLISVAIDDVSLVKLWRRSKPSLLIWAADLRHGRGPSRFEHLLEALRRDAKPSKRRKYPSTRQRVEALKLPHLLPSPEASRATALGPTSLGPELAQACAP